MRFLKNFILKLIGKRKKNKPLGIKEAASILCAFPDTCVIIYYTGRDEVSIYSRKELSAPICSCLRIVAVKHKQELIQNRSYIILDIAPLLESGKTDVIELLNIVPNIHVYQ